MHCKNYSLWVDLLVVNIVIYETLSSLTIGNHTLDMLQAGKDGSFKRAKLSTRVQVSTMTSRRPTVCFSVLSYSDPQHRFTHSVRRAFNRCHMIEVWLIFLSLALPLVEVLMSSNTYMGSWEFQGLHPELLIYSVSQWSLVRDWLWAAAFQMSQGCPCPFLIQKEAKWEQNHLFWDYYCSHLQTGTDITLNWLMCS